MNPLLHGNIGEHGYDINKFNASNIDDVINEIKGSGSVVTNKTNTVWDDIKATQPNMEGSAIPKSFEIDINGEKYWVAPNGTKHMYEYSTKGLSATPNRLSLSNTQKLTEQELLKSFQSAVEEASKMGFQYNVPIKVGDWELIFSPAREVGQLPVIKHAVYMP